LAFPRQFQASSEHMESAEHGEKATERKQLSGSGCIGKGDTDPM